MTAIAVQNGVPVVLVSESQIKSATLQADPGTITSVAGSKVILVQGGMVQSSVGPLIVLGITTVIFMERGFPALLEGCLLVDPSSNCTGVVSQPNTAGASYSFQ